MTIPLPLQEALRDSITSGTFVDTKFWIFSKRGSKAGRVGQPKALFVNGHVAKHVPRLRTRTAFLLNRPSSSTNLLAVLEDKKIEENLRARFPIDRKPYTNDYGYDDDSDLEEGDDDDISDDELAVPPQATKKSGIDSDLATVEKSDSENNECPDIISVSDIDSLFSESPDTKDEAKPVSSAHVGKVFIIEDVAFVT